MLSACFCTACFCSIAQWESKSRFSSRLHPVLPFLAAFHLFHRLSALLPDIPPKQRNKRIHPPPVPPKFLPVPTGIFTGCPIKACSVYWLPLLAEITPPRVTFLLILLYKISTCLPSLKLVLLPYTKRASACIVHFRYRSRSSFPKIFILFIEPLFCRAAGLRSPLQIPAHIQTVPGHLKFLP